MLASLPTLSWGHLRTREVGSPQTSASGYSACIGKDGDAHP